MQLQGHTPILQAGSLSATEEEMWARREQVRMYVLRKTGRLPPQVHDKMMKVLIKANKSS